MAKQSRIAFEHSAFPETRAVETTVVAALAEGLAELGVELAFGTPGDDGIAVFVDALVESPIDVRYFQHESGAAFAAMEASFASGKPVAVFSSSAPGILNVLNGLTAARWDGAKVVLVSSVTQRSQRGRWARREASPYTLPQDALYKPGVIFDDAKQLEHGNQLAEILRRFEAGFRRPQGFVAHIGLPRDLQAKRIDWKPIRPAWRMPSMPPKDRIDICEKVIREESFAIWAGFGASRAAPMLRTFAERTGARIFCSPRGKGVFPETHPLFVGVTGIGGHDEVADFMAVERPDWIFVLGSRLSEPTSFWDPDLIPKQGFLHVDIDPDIPGTAYPDAYTLGIEAEVGAFLESLLERLDAPKDNVVRPNVPLWRLAHEEPRKLAAAEGPIRPQFLMQILQHRVVEATDTIVLAECGNSFAWCNHHLRFDQPNRYRVSPRYGSMGHATCGVVGVAHARHGKAVAVTGDGSMLMASELGTAIRYDIQAVWIVLNDAGYGMCRDGQEALQLTRDELTVPEVDFAAMAQAMGALGERIVREEDLDAAVDRAMRAKRPFVLDVVIDPNQPSPLYKRFESLMRQGESTVRIDPDDDDDHHLCSSAFDA